MAIKLPKGFLGFTGFDINRITSIEDVKKLLRQLYDDLNKLGAYLNVESTAIQQEVQEGIIKDHDKLNNLGFVESKHEGFEPEQVKGTLAGSGAIIVTPATRKVIGGDAVISLNASAISDCFGWYWSLLNGGYSSNYDYLASDGRKWTSGGVGSAVAYTMFYLNKLTDKIRVMGVETYTGHGYALMAIDAYWDGIWHVIETGTTQFTNYTFVEIPLPAEKVVQRIRACQPRRIYDIVSADAETKTFRIAGDQTAYFQNYDHIIISGSQNNDEQYTLAGDSTYSAPNTVITVVEDVVSSGADGKLSHLERTIDHGYDEIIEIHAHVFGLIKSGIEEL